MSLRARELMREELERNKEIHKLGGNIEDDAKELDLHDQHVVDVKAVTKMIRFKQQLEDLDLSGNKLGNHGAADVASMIIENETIKRLILNDCDIGSKGLQEIVSALCVDDNETITYLDIRNNFVPDKHLKMLLVLVYKNRRIQ